MFMPPPTDEQQAMQYKMMNVMTLVMGVMFYRVPAGLCVYFISSSLWGVGERKLLEFWKKKHPPKVAPPESPTAEGEKQRALASIPGNKVAARAGEAAGSFWKKLLDAADHARAGRHVGLEDHGLASQGSLRRQEERQTPRLKSARSLGFGPIASLPRSR